MERRRSNRIRHRLTCELLIGQQVHPAIVRDLGPTGIFVQTRARPDANSVVQVRFPATAGLPAFCMEAGVARHLNVHPRLQAEIQSGIGLEVLGHPPDYRALAKRLGEPKTGDPSPATSRPAAQAASRPWPTRPPAAASSPAKAERLEMRRFRVRLAAIDRSVPRTLLVRAASIADARAQASGRAGAGWRVMDVQTI